MPRFCFYSKDISPTRNPQTASPQPSTLIVLDQDPLYGEYSPRDGSDLRGSVRPTFGGVVVQDFGRVAAGTRIEFSEEDALSESTVRAIEALIDTGVSFYFTDGICVWEAIFARPGGFRAWPNIVFDTIENVRYYSYEASLVVLDEISTGTMTTTTTTTTSSTTTTTTAP